MDELGVYFGVFDGHGGAQVKGTKGFPHRGGLPFLRGP